MAGQTTQTKCRNLVLFKILTLQINIFVRQEKGRVSGQFVWVVAMLGEGLPRGVGQEEAHEAAAGQEYGHDEGGRGAVCVQQRSDHHVAYDTA